MRVSRRISKVRKPASPHSSTFTPNARGEALRALGILDSSPEEGFEDIVHLAAQVCSAPIARISFVEEHREWFKASVGDDVCEAPVANSICARAVEQNALFIICDLASDPRFKHFDAVQNAPFLRFYAGAPLKTSDGIVVGMLCVLDHAPRSEGLAPAEATALEALARSVMSLVELRQVNLQLRESEDHYRASVELSSQVPWTADVQGNILEVGPKWLKLVGMSEEETLGTGWLSALHPQDMANASVQWVASLTSGEPLDMEYRIRLASGDYRWVRARAAPRRHAGGSIIRWYGSLENIHDRKLAQDDLRRSEAQFRDMADNAPFMVWVTAPNGSCQYLSKSWFEFTGQLPSAAYGLGWSQVVHVGDRARVRETFMQANERASAFQLEYRLRYRDGNYRWVIDAAAPRFGSDGVFLGYVGSVIDISDRKAAEEQTRRSTRQLETVLESTLDTVLIVNQDWRIQYTNEQAIVSIGGGASLLGKDLREVVREPAFVERYKGALKGQVAVQFEEYSAKLSKWFSSRAVGTPAGLIIFLHDITAQKRAWEVVEHQARHDALTGLLNRASFRERLASVLNDHRSAAVLMVDLDDFKSVNDTYGHPVGDELLCQVSAALSRQLPEDCLLARLGGDEFALMLTGVADVAEFADDITAVLASSFDVSGRRIWTGASIGFASAPADGTNADELISNADIALYVSKAAGGGKARRFQRVEQERIVLRESLKQDLTTALETGQLSLAYQPQVHLQTRELVGFEALLRWSHPIRGPVSPVDFIPLAEETGLIEKIGAWVLEQACHEAAGWPPHVSVAVNLSPVQFRSPRLAFHVLDSINRSGIEPWRVKLEVTESVLLGNSASNVEILNQIRELGARISLDDFGTGFSSLSYLRSFQFDEIKIDRSFVSDINHVRQSEAIIAAVASLAKSLKVRVTAEGVETEAQRNWLLSHDVPTAQGHLFGRPTDRKGIAEVLKSMSGPSASTYF
jgi:diguanylate cyclase (GGDEF)-like protein/PAS domain S-box-containing protein